MNSGYKESFKFRRNQTWVQEVEGNIVTKFKLLTDPFYWNHKWWIVCVQSNHDRPQVHTCEWMNLIAKVI